ncbi:IucA/IucC family protein [Massilia cavernae]|uniref:Iron transporter n=1 Tax=Massilia cavernae TaxID=2320864 RepID=A0A418XXW5_9BURK|nr:IucA/IucC family protein [Massilia cavernae]RJG17749.1 iron transporter [Massilia cavernae]
MQITNSMRAHNPERAAQQDAGRRSMETLLNCYCREVAEPHGYVSVGPLFGQNDWPQSVRMALSQAGGSVMHVRLAKTEARLLAVVDHASPTGNYRYHSSFYCKLPARPWTLLEPDSMASLLLRELSLQTDTGFNEELMQQIRDSVGVTAAILQAGCSGPFPASPLQAFIASEQSLTFGHPFHPAPKSRQGVSHEDMLRYSPEMGASFPLHYFAVRREYLLQQSVLAESCDSIVARQAGMVPEKDYALVPTHPWQARYLLGHPEVVRAIRDGRIRDLGPQGEVYFPTSSIRTLFSPGDPYFYKCSLNIRITNCVRKNAIYELEGALQVTRIMRELMPDLRRRFPGMQVMEEPAFMSIDLKLDDRERNREVVEGFGMILREAFQDSLESGVTPLLAGSLFGNHLEGEARLRELLSPLAQGQANPESKAIEDWFSHYVMHTLYPVLYCYFAHGVIFEPHLQNVVIGVKEGAPRQVFLRDFEGVKLLQERYDERQLKDVSARGREALWYSSELGWKRIAYCLFVNNYCEAIAQLGAGNAVLQCRLWEIVRHHLQAFQREHGDAASALRIDGLLNGEALPGKTNMLNRFHMRADRATTYVPVNNPMGRTEARAWS